MSTLKHLLSAKISQTNTCTRRHLHRWSISQVIQYYKCGCSISIIYEYTQTIDCIRGMCMLTKCWRQCSQWHKSCLYPPNPLNEAERKRERERGNGVDTLASPVQWYWGITGRWSDSTTEVYCTCMCIINTHHSTYIVVTYSVDTLVSHVEVFC